LNYFNYFSEIEETFIRRRGRNLLLSPLDWALIETWQERGIPLRIVLRAIENVFDSYDKNPNKRRVIKSLTYCKEEIEAQYAEWLESQVGKNGKAEKTVQDSKLKIQNSKFKDQVSESQNSSLENRSYSGQAILAHLEKVSDELEKVEDKTEGRLREILLKVLKRLTELKNNLPEAGKLEETLEKMDDAIDKILLQSYAEDQKLKAEIEKQIASYKNKMETEAYQRTFDLMLIKDLRERIQIPRISLFYM
jgi:hypothetical protein